MRSTVLASAVVTAMLISAPTWAQVQEGPLADPSAQAAPAPAKTAKTPSKAHRKPAKSAALPGPIASATPTAKTNPSALPTPHGAQHGAPAASDPVSFGLKWNGANDNAEKTRVQNYGNDAVGTGAEVGMKLHF